MKYSIHNVVVVPKKEDRAKLIGRNVYAGDNIPELIINANNGDGIMRLDEVLDTDMPFLCSSKTKSSRFSAIIVRKEYVPFDSFESFKNEYIKRIGDSSFFLLDETCNQDPYTYVVTGYRNSGLLVAGCEYSWEELLKFYTFPDGSPVGFLEE